MHICKSRKVKMTADRPDFEEESISLLRQLLSGIEDYLFKGYDRWPDIPPGQNIDPFHLECDVSADPDTIGQSEVSNALLLGRLPNYAPYDVTKKQFSLFFPRGMATEALFPQVSSSYTDPDNGITY